MDFREHLQNMFNRINKTISLLRKLPNNFPRAPLLTIYKSFIRPHLDYGDILYDQTFNNSFHERLKSIQYNAALAITGAIRGSSREKLYQELGFESLQQRRWYRKLCLLYKKIKNQSPKYLSELIPPARQAYMTRYNKSITLLNVKHDYFKNSFFPSTIIEWNNLHSSVRNSENLALFKKRILAFIRPSANNTFHCINPNDLKLITRLRVGLSHLRFHKFKHSFQDTLNPICNCGTVKTTIHYLLLCPNFSNERLTLFNKLQSIDENILSKDDFNISKVLLFGDNSFNDAKNTSVPTASIEYIISTKRFDAPLYQN